MVSDKYRGFLCVLNSHDDFVERVRSQSDIVSVISSYVPLKNGAIVIGAVVLFIMKKRLRFR